LAACLGLVWAGAAHAARLPLRGYTTADGLPHDRVEMIAQDSRGFVWLGTPEGLTRFDGYGFTTLGAESGIPGGAVRALLEVKDEYWVGTEDGLCVLRVASSRCERRALAEDAHARHVNALALDARGRVWAATAAGAFRSDAERRSFTRVDPPKGTAVSSVLALATDGDGGAWFGGPGGLWHARADGGVSALELERERPWVASLLVDGDQLWVGRRGGLMRLTLAGAARGRREVVWVGGGPAGTVRALLKAEDGILWAGTQNVGLLRVEGTQAVRYGTEAGLSSFALRALAQDKDGNLWIGTEARGAMKLARHGLVSYGREDGLNVTRIISVFGDARGNVYAHTGAGALHRFDGAGWQDAILPFRTGIRGPFAFGMRLVTQDDRGAWWVGTGWGLFRFAPADHVSDLRQTPRPTARLTADTEGGPAPAGPLLEDRRGDVWAGAVAAGRAVLLRWQRSSDLRAVVSFPRDVPAAARVLAMAEDAGGTLWIGLSEGGLLRRRGERVEHVGLDAPGPLGAIHDLHVHGSTLWIAAEGTGLGRLETVDVGRPTLWWGRAQGLASDQASCVTEDRWGRVYVGTALGVTRLDPETGHLRQYGTSDGLSSVEVTSAFADGRGRLWFGTIDGISRVDPTREPAVPAPRVYIAGLRLGGVRHPLSVVGEERLSGFELGPDEAQVELEYASLAFGLGERLRYRYRLDGADRDWSAATDERKVQYARLAPGAYTFQVEAVNADGKASARPASVAFRVLPPLWRRTWFVSSGAGVFLLLAYAAYRTRVGMLLEVERVRLRVASDLHDDIGSNLSKIAILSEVARRQEPAERESSLTHIADMARQLVDSMSDIVWAVNPSRDSLPDLTRRLRAFANELLSPLDVVVAFDLPPDTEHVPIGAELRRQAFLVFKEAVTNAAAHAGARRVEIELKVGKGQLLLRVSDDGRGFDPAAASDGHGLTSLRERARAIGGELTIESSPGQGTTVRLRAPLAGRRRGRTHYLTA
jgi:signal transduction histidine kinase/ligand-binding sensor domain-containing protein